MKRKGVAARRGLKEAWNNPASRNKDGIGVLGCRASGHAMAKLKSIKGTGGQSGGCTWKAIELISGDLLHGTEP